MTDLDTLLAEIRPQIEEHFEEKFDEEFVPGETTIPLSQPTFGADEVVESLDSLLSTWVTMGEKVSRFEQEWSDYVGTEHAVMVNSGSSANLVALKSLQGNVIEEDSEVIVPAVSWSTSVFPIVDIGATPVFVDVDLETYTIDTDAIEEAVTEKTSAIMPVHLLGNPAEMDTILSIAEEHDLAVIEDCCEAHGAEYQGQKVGTFGDVGTFSFFFSHHISTIEGGMVVTDSLEQRERSRMLRAHGWTREVEEDYTEQYPDIDERFLFASHGYNLRPTEIQGAFGIHQVEKLDQFVNARRENAAYLNEHFAKHEQLHLLNERPDTRCSWFAYPILVKPDSGIEREELQEHLEEHGIETRPVLAGNLTKQPAFEEIPHRIAGNLSASETIHDSGFFIGNHHRLTDEHLDYIIRIVDEYINGKAD